MARGSSIPWLSSRFLLIVPLPPPPSLTVYPPQSSHKKPLQIQIRLKNKPKSNQIMLLIRSKPSNGSSSHTSPHPQWNPDFLSFNSPCDLPPLSGQPLSFLSSLHSLCSRSAACCSQLGQSFSISRSAPSSLTWYSLWLTLLFHSGLCSNTSSSKRLSLTTMYHHHTSSP